MKKLTTLILIAILALSVLSITGCVKGGKEQVKTDTVKEAKTEMDSVVEMTSQVVENSAGPYGSTIEGIDDSPGVTLRRFHDELLYWEKRVGNGEDIGYGSFGDYLLPAAEALAVWDMLSQDDVNRMGQIIDNSESSICSLEDIVDKSGLMFPEIVREDEQQ